MGALKGYSWFKGPRTYCAHQYSTLDAILHLTFCWLDLSFALRNHKGMVGDEELIS